jgi:hypothetical protein
MPAVIVSENIQRIEDLMKNYNDEISNLDTRKEEIRMEIARLEGCMLTFNGFRDAGIETILPEHEKNEHHCEQNEHHCEQNEHHCEQNTLEPIQEREHEHGRECSRHEHDKKPVEDLYTRYRAM